MKTGGSNGSRLFHCRIFAGRQAALAAAHMAGRGISCGFLHGLPSQKRERPIWPLFWRCWRWSASSPCGSGTGSSGPTWGMCWSPGPCMPLFGYACPINTPFCRRRFSFSAWARSCCSSFRCLRGWDWRAPSGGFFWAPPLIGRTWPATSPAACCWEFGNGGCDGGRGDPHRREAAAYPKESPGEGFPAFAEKPSRISVSRRT